VTTLLTGSEGFVGRHLRPLITDEEVIQVDRTLGTDLTDHGIALRLAVQGIDTVFHLAAEHFVPWCRLHPVETLETNVYGMMNLLAGFEQHPPKRIVFASSAAVYGLADTPRLEHDPVRPVDVYGSSKAIGEQLLASFALRHPETTCVSARLANIYGPDDPHQHVIPVLLEARAAGETPALGNLWPRRDYVHVDDVADALLVLEALDPGYYVYNVGTGLGTTVMGLLTLLGTPWTIDPAKQRDSDGHLVLDVDKITRDTGWIARHAITEVFAA
jgi:nucleoside-diphosphate-sugar epimerase